MITVCIGDFVYKYDGKLGTIEDTVNKCMYFLDEHQVSMCNQSNLNIEFLIKLIS